MTTPIKASAICIAVIFLWAGLGFLGVTEELGPVRIASGVGLISLASVLWLVALQ